MLRYLTLVLLALAAALPLAAQQQATVSAAREAFERTNYDDAIQIATRVLRQDRDNIDARLIRARAYEAADRPESAEPDYQYVLSLDPDNAAAVEGLRRSRATVRGAANRDLEERGLGREVRDDPDNLTLRLRYAESLFRRRDFRAAADQYEAYLARTQGNPGIVQRYLISIANYQGGNARGEVEARRFLDFYPTSDDLWMRLGYFRLWQGKYQTAREAFEQALRLNPDNTEARRGLTEIDRPDSRANTPSNYPIDVLVRELSAEPNDDAKRFRLVDLLIESGRYFEAQQNLDVLEARYADDEDFQRRQAVVARNLPREARGGARGGGGTAQPTEFIVDRLYRQVRADSTNDERRFQLVDALIDYDRFAEAYDQLLVLEDEYAGSRRWLELFVQVDEGYLEAEGSSPIYEIDRLRYRLSFSPGDDATRIALAEAYLAEGRAEEAFQTLTLGELRAAGDARMRALFERIETVREQARQQRIAELQATLAQNPDDTSALYEIAQLYLADQDPSRSIAAYERLLALEPGNLEARYNFAQTLNVAGFFDDALDEAIFLLDRQPNNFEYRELFVLTAIAADQIDETVESFLVSLLQRDPDNATLLLELGAIRLSQQRLDEADELVRRALALGLAQSGGQGIDQDALGIGQRAEVLAALIERERVRLQDESEIALLNDARVLARNGFYGDAVDAYEAYFALMGRRTRDELKEYAGVYSAAGDFVTALSIYRALLLERYEYDVAKEITKNLFYLGDYAGTIESTQRVLAENPRDFEVRLLLADAYREAERFELAAEQYALARQYGANSELIRERERLLAARARFSIVEPEPMAGSNFAAVFSPHVDATIARGGGADYQRYGGGSLAQVTIPGGAIATVGLTSHWMYGTELLSLNSDRVAPQQLNQVYTGLLYDFTREEIAPNEFAFTNRLQGRVGMFDYDGGRTAPFVELRYWNQSPGRYRASVGIQNTEGTTTLWSPGGSLYDLRLTQIDGRYESRAWMPDSLFRTRGVVAFNFVDDTFGFVESSNNFGLNINAEGSYRILPKLYLGAAYYLLDYRTTTNLYFSPDGFSTYDAFLEFERGSEIASSYTRIRTSLGFVGRSGGTIAYRVEGDVIRRLTNKLSFIFNFGLGQSTRPLDGIDNQRYTIASAALGVYWTL
jgi:thioredoxin-like negative regulator of GroEL